MFRDEIGSEFWDVPLKSDICNIFDSDELRWFLSGRIALKAIIADILKTRNFNFVYLPSWCCESMVLPFTENGVKVKFYPVYISDGVLTVDFPATGDAILVMDYFGYNCDFQFSEFSGIVIHDVTHSVPCGLNTYGDYIFGSLRKWFGIATGGFAVKRNAPWLTILPDKSDDFYVGLRNKAFKEKKSYIFGQSDNKYYLQIFNKAEEYLDNLHGVFAADATDINFVNNIDFDFITKKRRENASCLIENLADSALFKTIGQVDVPLFVPIIVNNREQLRCRFIENKIFCPVHWPKFKSLDCDAKCADLYDSEISLICDQRYSIQDMQKIIEIIKGL